MLGYYPETERVTYGEGIKGTNFKVRGLGDFDKITPVEQKNALGSEIKTPKIKILVFRNREKRLELKLDTWSNKTRTNQLKNLNPSRISK